MLGGQVVASFSLLKDAQNRFWQSYNVGIFFDGGRIADYSFNYPNAGTSYETTKQVTWVYDNPVTGGRYAHVYKSHTGGPPEVILSGDSEMDRVGTDVGATNPYAGTPPPTDNIELDVDRITGDIHDYRASCKIDGVPTPCMEVLHRLNTNPGDYHITSYNRFRVFLTFDWRSNVGGSSGLYLDRPHVVGYFLEPQGQQRQQQPTNAKGVQPNCYKFVDSLVKDVEWGYKSKDRFPVKGGISGSDLTCTNIGSDMVRRAIDNVDVNGDKYIKGPPLPQGFRQELIDNGQGGDVYHHIEFVAGNFFLGAAGQAAIAAFIEVDRRQAQSGRKESETELRDDEAGKQVGRAMLQAFYNGKSDKLRTRLRGILCVTQ